MAFDNSDNRDNDGLDNENRDNHNHDSLRSSSAFLELCSYCRRFRRGDDLTIDNFGHRRCQDCSDGTCANCWKDKRAFGSNLCEDCLRRYGMEALTEVFSHGIRAHVQDYGVPFCGFLQGIVLYDGDISLLIAVPRNEVDEKGHLMVPVHWVRADAVLSIESCGEFSGPSPGKFGAAERRRLFAWLGREQELYMISYYFNVAQVSHTVGDAGEDGDAQNEDDEDDEVDWEADWEEAVENGSMSPDEDYCEEDGTIHIRRGSTGPDWNAIGGDRGDAHTSRTAESLRALLESLGVDKDPDETGAAPRLEAGGADQADSPKESDS